MSSRSVTLQRKTQVLPTAVALEETIGGPRDSSVQDETVTGNPPYSIPPYCCELEFRSMIDEPQARESAIGAFESEGVVLGVACELNAGWFFPCVTKGVQIFAGAIVNKATGRPLLVMAQSPMASDLTLYDRGYQVELM
jgi:hypothetical protein